ncbi:MAG TPA: glycosyltransferase family 2 protein, partial [Candidatus Gemmiger excrementipullorum]|nr:glycosyltransferase family 2 protein [Candidatus Gemmiger excrementipullorum]
DVLYPNALFACVQTIQTTGADFVYSDEIVLSADLKQLGGYHFKPDFAPDYLRGVNFITHLAVFSRPLLDAAGAYESREYDGAQDHDLFLRLTEKARKIEHIKQVLYIWRGHAGSTAAGMEAKPYAVEAGVRAIDAQLARLGLPGKAMPVPGAPGAFQVRYELTGCPLVSVLIPNKDHTADLDRCLTSLYQNAGYDNFEVLVIENNSTDPATEAYYQTLPGRFARCRVVRYQGPFNFSAINNFGAQFAAGEHLLLLNNDIEILSGDFLRELLSYSQRPDVGAVGAKLYYPDDTIQHAGVLMGINGSAGHSHKSYPRTAVGDLYRLVTTQNYMAVTGACLMTKASLYHAAGGLDEEQFAVAYNDVDYCLKLWGQGLLNVYTPRAEAYHYESKSRGLDTLSENAQRYEREKANFYAKYKQYIDNYDPYYNPHFNNLFENFGLK